MKAQMHCRPAVEEAVELIAVVAIEIGALLALIVIATLAFSAHNRLLQRTVEYRRADLRIQRVQAGAVETSVHRHWRLLSLAGGAERHRMEGSWET
jgi:hypothetical protein